MENGYQKTDKQLKQQCVSEYLEQMKWTYQGGIGASTLKESNPEQYEKTIYMSTAYAHIDYAFKTLKPLYLFWLDKNSESQANTDLQNLELESLSVFCKTARVKYQQVTQFIEDDAQKFIQDNSQRRESYPDFDSRVRQADSNFKERSYWWRESVRINWYIFSSSNENKTVRSVDSNSTSEIQRKEPISIKEKVNWDKIKRPEEMDSLRKKKNASKVSKKSIKNNREQNNVISLSNERSERFFNYLKGELDSGEFDSTELFTTAFTGWSWMCESHKCYGIGDNEEEVLFMSGSHMYYVEKRSTDCEIFTREF